MPGGGGLMCQPHVTPELTGWLSQISGHEARCQLVFNGLLWDSIIAIRCETYQIIISIYLIYQYLPAISKLKSMYDIDVYFGKFQFISGDVKGSKVRMMVSNSCKKKSINRNNHYQQILKRSSGKIVD